MIRPRTRAECVNGLRPCPWLGCKHHLALDVTPNGKIRLPFGDDPDLAALAHTCSLDVADEGDHSLDAVGALMGITRERVRQIEEIALGKARGEFPEDADVEELLP